MKGELPSSIPIGTGCSFSFVTIGTNDLVVLSGMAPLKTRAGALENSLMYNDWRASIMLKLFDKYCIRRTRV